MSAHRKHRNAPPRAAVPASRLRAWLELMRLSNLPTAWSNALTGLAMGYMAVAFSHPGFAVPGQMRLLWSMLVDGWPIFIAVTLFYVGGMMLNDVVDHRIDRTERPERPIPSGRVGLTAARLAVLLCLLPAMGIMLSYGEAAGNAALLLVALIALYNLLHKRWRGAVIFMGGARAMLYVMPALVYLAPSQGLLHLPLFTPDAVRVDAAQHGVDAGAFTALLAPYALILGLYVILLTVAAQMENAAQPGWRRWVGWALIPLTLVILPAPAALPWALLALLALVGWLIIAALRLHRQPADTRGAVHGWLAGICLLDAYFLTLLGLPVLALASAVLFALTLLGHRRIMGT